MLNLIQNFFEGTANILESIVFFNILFFTPYKMPLVIFMVFAAVVYFSFILKFINFTHLGTSIKIFFEKEKEVDGNKAVTSKAAFLSAISGCVGVGSISGVAAALYAGGAGSVFWMLVFGFLVMPLRFAEVFLGHFYRSVSKDGTISRYGPYAYIETGLVKEGYSPKLAKFLFIFYVISILVGGIGAFIMQANPMAEIAGEVFFKSHKGLIFAFSLALAGLSVFVIIGGLKRIVHIMQRAVSVMSILYLLTILLILALNIQNIPSVISHIIQEAFNFKSAFGGIIGITIVAITRTIVSTEVGLGTVSFLHGKAQNKSSKREALLAMGGPFFANFLFIILNSIAVLASLGFNTTENGILLINRMFFSVHPSFTMVLLVITFLFGFTTIIAWYFYGESSILQITQKKWALKAYRMLFFILISVSGLVSFGVMLRIIDAVVLAIIFPNIIALFLLSKALKREVAKKLA